jgi:hypothetical protein
VKKALIILMVLTVAAALSACSDGDDHGVIFNHEGFLSGLFGAAPVSNSPTPTAPLATPTTETTSANS